MSKDYEYQGQTYETRNLSEFQTLPAAAERGAKAFDSLPDSAKEALKLTQAEKSKESLAKFAENHPLKKEQERVKRMEEALERISDGRTVENLWEAIEIASEALED